MTTIETAEPAPPESDAHASAPDSEARPHHGTVTVRPPMILSSTDHKIIGQLFLFGGLLGLLATVVVNVIIGIERVDGGDLTFDDAISQLFDAQRVGLVFGAALPLALALCVAIVPLQLGSRAIAFPRLATIGFWLWFGGLVLNIVALASDGGTLGGSGDMVDLFIASLGLMAVGAVAAAMSIGATVLTTRAPGMTMRRMPFFSLVGVDHLDHARARDARVHRHARLPLPRPPQHTRRLRRQRRLRHLGGMALHPAGHLHLRHPGRRPVRRTAPRQLPPPHPGTRRDDLRPRPPRRRRPRRRHPAERGSACPGRAAS